MVGRVQGSERREARKVCRGQGVQLLPCRRTRAVCHVRQGHSQRRGLPGNKVRKETTRRWDQQGFGTQVPCSSSVLQLPKLWYEEVL